MASVDESGGSIAPSHEGFSKDFKEKPAQHLFSIVNKAPVRVAKRSRICM